MIPGLKGFAVRVFGLEHRGFDEPTDRGVDEGTQMTRDRMIQFAALGLMVVLIALSAWVTGPVSTQRRELQLDLGDQMGRSAPPGVVLANALGAFRGLAVDILWYRVNQMKEDGKLYEVNQLSRRCSHNSLRCGRFTRGTWHTTCP